MNLDESFAKLITTILNSDKLSAEAFTRCQRKGVGVSVLVPNRVTHRAVDRICYGVNQAEWNECKGSTEVGGCGCIHAEVVVVSEIMRAIEKVEQVTQLVMLSTYSPCAHCANLIVSSKMFQSVVYLIETEYENQGVDILTTGGIRVFHAKTATQLSFDTVFWRTARDKQLYQSIS